MLFYVIYPSEQKTGMKTKNQQKKLKIRKNGKEL